MFDFIVLNVEFDVWIVVNLEMGFIDLIDFSFVICGMFLDLLWDGVIVVFMCV